MTWENFREIALLVAAVSSFLLPPEGNRFAEPFEVVRDGKAVADIVIPNEEKNVPCVRKGAEELLKRGSHHFMV